MPRYQSSLQHPLDLFEIVMSHLLLLLAPLFFRWKGNRLWRQREDLIERELIGQKRPFHQPFSGFAQSGQSDLQNRGDPIIVIETQSITIRDGDQKQIQEDLDRREIMEEASRNKAMVDPAKGAFDLSNSVRAKESFDNHRPHILASMMPFSLGQLFLSNEFWISRQGKVEKRNVISGAWI